MLAGVHKRIAIVAPAKLPSCWTTRSRIGWSSHRVIGWLDTKSQSPFHSLVH